MPGIYKNNCKTCGKYYEGRGKIYCSNKCHMVSPEAIALIKKCQSGTKHSIEHKNKISQANSGVNHWNYGRTLSVETKKKISQHNAHYWKNKKRPGLIEKMKESAKKYGFGSYWRGKKRPISTILKMKKAQQILRIDKLGEKCIFWKGGISKDKKHRLLQAKVYCHNRKTRTKDLTIKKIQQTYENNIKKYGTLTCYLCLKPIEFKQDCLEHKTPLSRGGNNKMNNLGIAHRSCNTKKFTMTELEFRQKGGVKSDAIRVPRTKS